MASTSEDKTETYREAFNLFDKDRNGHVTVTELSTMMRALGKTMSEEEVKKMIKAADKDENGTVEFAEFCKFMEQREDSKDTEEDLRKAFKQFDADDNGFITHEELKKIMTTLGEPLTDAEVQEMMKEADLSGDGRIDYNEFIKMMMN